MCPHKASAVPMARESVVFASEYLSAFKLLSYISYLSIYIVKNKAWERLARASARQVRISSE